MTAPTEEDLDFNDCADYPAVPPWCPADDMDTPEN